MVERMIWSRIWKEIKYCSQVFLLPIYALSFLMPRVSNIWVLGSTFGERFSDNPKYFFLYLKQYEKENVRAVWITKNRDISRLLEENQLEAYYLYTLRGLWYCLRAKVYLYDNYSKDICFTLSGGALKINLWHGIPLKKIQKDNKFDYVRNPRNWIEKIRFMLRRVSDEKPSDYVLTTSAYLMPIFASAFQTSNIITCGYPRNDNLITKRLHNVLTKQEKAELQMIVSKDETTKIYIYLPTFRSSEAVFFEIIQRNRLNEFLEQKRIMLLIKPHPKSREYIRYKELTGNRIKVLNPCDDPYPFLEAVDGMITDYSSIFFDFLLTGKPIIFFPFDLKEYCSQARELYFNYQDYTPGLIVTNQTELEEALEKPVLYQKKIHDILEKTYDKPEQFASRQLYESIKEILKER